MRRITRMLGAVSCGLVAVAAPAMSTSAGDISGYATGHIEHHLTGAHAGHNARHHFEIAILRLVTARFHDLDVALEAGYELGWVNGSGTNIITGCVAHPTAGAMGYHYFNKQLMDDLAVDFLQPEVLVYAPGPQGKLRLVAVEWVARGPNTNPPGVTEPPTVLGMPMHILNPAVGFYLMHAWIWKPNPAGMFADWNPNVTCP